MEEERIVVETEVLLFMTDEVENVLKKMKGLFRCIEETIERSCKYWEGDGNQAYLNKMLGMRERVNEITGRFEGNISNLRKITGIYEEVESVALSETDALPSGLIV